MSEILRYGVMSDTHDSIHPGVFDVFEGVRCIFHCGDVGSHELVVELQVIAPLVAVSGNMDPWPILSLFPDEVVEDREFGTVAMLHGACFSHTNQRIAQAMLSRYNGDLPRLILFGHSHQPYLARRGKTLILNPGAVTYPRTGHAPSVAIVEYDAENDALNAKHVELT